MALVLKDRVKETATSPGTGSVTLLGASTGFQSFAVIGNANTCYYTISDQGGPNWEVGIGTYSTTGPTLARTTVLASSNAGSLTDFNAGTQDVFVTYPAEKGVWLDASGNAIGLGTPAAFVGTNITGTATALSIGGNAATATTAATASAATGPLNGTLGATTPSTAVVTSLTDSGLTAGRVTYASTSGLLADSANLTFDGTTLSSTKATLTAAGSATTGASQLYLNGATSNRIDWSATGTGAPAFTTRSDGTKALLYPALSGSQVDYAIGINSATLWSSVPVNSASFYFKWYGGETQIASLDGTGALAVSETVTGAELLASNGLVLNNMTVGANYSIPSGYSASSVGPVVISGGVTVTVGVGSRWVVL